MPPDPSAVGAQPTGASPAPPAATQAPAAQPPPVPGSSRASTSSAMSLGIKAITLLSGSGGPPWGLIALIGGVLGLVGGLGFAAMKDGEKALVQSGAATARLSDLQASEAARAALQKRLDAVTTETAAEIAQMQAEHDARVGALERAAAAKIKAVKTCPIDLRRARSIK